MHEEIVNRNKNINRGYRKLEVWKEAVNLYVMVRNEIRNLKKVPIKIKAQVEDSAFSSSSNIAEGDSRRGLKENIQFNTIALASLSENYTQIFALHEAGDIDKLWFDQYDALHYSLENKLLKMNKTLIEKIGKNDWKDDYNIRTSAEY